MRAVRILSALLLLSAAAIAHDLPMPSPDPTRAAQQFVAILRPGLKAQCLLPIEHPDRLTWSYLPGRRRGITLKQMSEAERRAAHAMLRAALSPRGYQKTQGVLELEGILREIETFGGLRRDPELYFLAIFGTPSDEKPWGWRFEGHHLALNFSSATGRIVASTPAFFGANPARVQKGPRAGWRVLAAEEDLARELLAGCDRTQRAKAIIATSAPSDIILGPDRQSVPEPAGLAYGEMSERQRQILMRLIDEYIGNMREEVARAQREKVEKSGVASIRFAWAGGTRVGEGHYYRIQGPTFVIEYDNTQNGANHVHSVWRDLEDDFGGDLLRRHYAESPDHAGERPAPLSSRAKRGIPDSMRAVGD
jgi:hypothetical protein